MGATISTQAGDEQLVGESRRLVAMTIALPVVVLRLLWESVAPVEVLESPYPCSVTDRASGEDCAATWRPSGKMEAVARKR